MPEPELTSDSDERFKETISKDNQAEFSGTTGMGSILKDVRTPQTSEEGDPGPQDLAEPHLDPLWSCPIEDPAGGAS